MISGAAVVSPLIAAEINDRSRRCRLRIPSKIKRKVPIARDSGLCRQRSRVENMFGKLKAWRRIHIRHGRCAHIFFSAICIAATVIFWINQ